MHFSPMTFLMTKTEMIVNYTYVPRHTINLSEPKMSALWSSWNQLLVQGSGGREEVAGQALVVMLKLIQWCSDLQHLHKDEGPRKPSKLPNSKHLISQFASLSVQFSRSVMSHSLQPHGLHVAHQGSLSITNNWSLLKLISIESVMPSNHFILCHPLLLPSIFPSIRVFSNESALHIRWPKYWRFSFSISPSNEYPGLIFRMDWLDLLESKGLSRMFSNTTVQRHQFFGAQLSL